MRVRCGQAVSATVRVGLLGGAPQHLATFLAHARRLDLEQEVVVRIVPVKLALELSTRAEPTRHGPTGFIEGQRVPEGDRDDQTANAALRHTDDALVETGDRAAVAHLCTWRVPGDELSLSQAIAA